ncbi:hypothetical protein [Streptomyces sp. NPDC056690]
MVDDGEARLAYVAVTRTRTLLDRGGLAWIDNHPQQDNRAGDVAG